MGADAEVLHAGSRHGERQRNHERPDLLQDRQTVGGPPEVCARVPHLECLSSRTGGPTLSIVGWWLPRQWQPSATTVHGYAFDTYTSRLEGMREAASG